MPIRRYYVTRRYSRRNTTPDAHCNQLGVGMRDPLICVRVLRTRVSARTAQVRTYVRIYVRTSLHRRYTCAPMQPDTGQRLRTHTRDCVQSHSDSAGFMLLALLINACASKRYDRFQIRFLIMIMCGRKSLLNNVDSFHLYAVEDRKTRCETFLCAFLIQQRTWNVIRNAFPKCFFFANDLLYCPKNVTCYVMEDCSHTSRV